MLTDEARTNEDYEELQYIKKKDHNLFFNEDVGFQDDEEEQEDSSEEE